MSESSTTRDLFGRTVIYADVAEVTAENIAEVMTSATETHNQNNADIDYLYQYYRGDQPVLERTKDFNENILNQIVVNRAKEIVDFKTGYFLSAPIQYIDRGEDAITEDLNRLNEWMMLENKEASDLWLAEWFTIGGTAYRMVLPKDNYADGDAPFEIHNLDPRNTFIVYSSRLGHKPVLGVTYVELDDDVVIYYCYTDKEFFVLDADFNDASDEFTKSGSHSLGTVPIFEYVSNFARLGAFEQVISLLDAINTTESNRVDGVEQFVQAILCIEGMNVPDDETDFMSRVKEVGGLCIPAGGKAYYLIQELNQQQTQTLIDDMYDAVLTICGLPNRHSGGTSTSDTGSAVMLRDGWSETEARAKRTETLFKQSERRFLNLILTICNAAQNGLNLMPSQVDIRFPRRNYTNDSAKVANLIAMLSSDWIPPQLAYEHSDMFADPNAAYRQAKEWHDTQEKQDIEALAVANKVEPDVEALQTQADSSTKTVE